MGCIYHGKSNRFGNTALASLHIDAAAARCSFALWLERRASAPHLRPAQRKQLEKQAIRECMRATALCEIGMSSLPADADYHYLFKRKIEPAYERCILFHSRWFERAMALEPRNATSFKRRLTLIVTFIETLRRKGYTARNLHQGEHSPVTLLFDLLRDRPFSEFVERTMPSALKPWAFIWLQGITGRPDELVFIAISPDLDRPVVRVISGEFLNLLDILRRSVAALADYAGEHLNAAEFEDVIAQSRALLDAQGSRALQELPRDVQQWFTGEKARCIFLSPCAHTVNLPFDMLQWRSPSEGDTKFTGQEVCIVRGRGLQEFHSILSRSTAEDPSLGPIIIVGTRNTSPQDQNEPVWQAHTELLKILTPLFEAYSLQPRQVLYEKIPVDFAEDFSLYWHWGHGKTLEVFLEGELLSEESFRAQSRGENPSIRLKGTIVHFDCCSGGEITHDGGGRFRSFQTTALTSGADCFICSPFALYIWSAREWSEHFYRSLLQDGATVGEAIMQARRRVFKQGRFEHPFFWACNVVWGSPIKKLIRKSK